MKTRLLKFILVAVVGLAMFLSLSAVASAETAHGGYSSLTNKCLQCHDIHTDADGNDADYVLLRWPTVVDTCGSCHSLYLGAFASDGKYGEYSYANLLFSGTPATASDRRAYKVAIDDQDTHAGHRMLQGGSYIIGGSGSLSAIDIWNKGVPGDGIYNLWSPYDANAPFVKGAGEFAATDGLYCASCHTPHADFGQQLDESQRVGFNPDGGGEHQNKLLSNRPNHSTDEVSVTDWAADGYKYCLACHDQRAPDHTEGWYNHPVEVCLVCHADDRDAEDYDFPHTSPNARILADEPDGLCVGCHGAGQLP